MSGFLSHKDEAYTLCTDFVNNHWKQLAEKLQEAKEEENWEIFYY